MGFAIEDRHQTFVICLQVRQGYKAKRLMVSIFNVLRWFQMLQK